MNFKCKMCGGTIEFNQGDTVGTCDSCGTKQTLPRLDDDKRANLYDRANHFRRNNEFDKAMGIYEQILNEDNTDAEAYWSLILCRYGVEYVEDPSTHRRVPTVNRAQFTSVYMDEDYKSALQYADGYQREIYEQEANEIDNIQKGILEISSKEEPFDVFICYKETDSNGRRTQDSVLANDLYYQLTQEGFKVFFSRITLEDKLGTAYEPYIFAALNSAKVMVVIGTKPEYFNAVWVKNEWSRYLSLVKQSGGKKLLIPAYRDMDPYDLPEEFSYLQAQDMSKLGFMQDLIRGIKKIIGVDAPKPSASEATINNENIYTDSLLRSAFMSIDDGHWQEADKCCERVLEIDPENEQAYLGKLMAELHVKQESCLGQCFGALDKSSNYIKIMQFGGDELKNRLKMYNDESKYNYAVLVFNNKDYISAKNLFDKIKDFKDSENKIIECEKHIGVTISDKRKQAEEIKGKKARIDSQIHAVDDELKALKKKGIYYGIIPFVFFICVELFFPYSFGSMIALIGYIYVIVYSVLSSKKKKGLNLQLEQLHRELKDINLSQKDSKEKNHSISDFPKA